MKKTLAIVLALAMVLVMSVSVFAAEKPADATDTDAWTAYYTELLSAEDVNPVDIATSLVADVEAGVVEMDVALNALETASFAVGSSEAFEAAKDLLDIEAGSVLPDFLPEDPVSALEATLANILDSIFGMIGDIVASLFGNDTSDYCFKTTTTTTTTTTTELVEDVPEMGDNSLIAVGAVALVAGAALVLTRKRDAE